MMIDIENLQLRIGRHQILHGIDLHLNTHDIYGLLGPNGAGKSTTIFALLGLHEYNGGSIRVLDRDPRTDARQIRRWIGVVPERSGFYEWMDAFAYLQWYARLYGRSPRDKDLRTLLGLVGLASVQHQPIATYSRGMKQRLAMARALVPDPRLLILDEPTNGLDPKGRREIHDMLLAFASESGCAVLLCTHLLDDVDRLCSRIGVVDQGRTRLEGGLFDLLAQHQGQGRYQLRLGNDPDTTDLPPGLSLLATEGRWFRVGLESRISGGPSAMWEELWRRGWRLLEIRSEASSLEQLYMRMTGHHRARVQEAQ